MLLIYIQHTKDKMDLDYFLLIQDQNENQTHTRKFVNKTIKIPTQELRILIKANLQADMD